MINISETNLRINECLHNLQSMYDIIEIFSLHDFSKHMLRLQSDLINIRKNEFLSNERIIFTITQDFHNKHYGVLLKSLQVIINSIDISNFFVIIVTTNEHILAHYSNIFKNYNSDNVSFEIYKCIGDYKAITNSLPKEYNLYDSLSQTTQYSDFTIKLLESNKHFCILPWVELQVDTHNEAFPCCVSDRNLPIGKFSINNMSDLFNNKHMKQIRLNMLTNKPSAECVKCYNDEDNKKSSYRLNANRLFYKHIDNIQNTFDDGLYPHFNLLAWDLRFNNLCNLKCRTCGPGASTSWKSDAIKLGNTKYITLQKPEGIITEHIKHIDDVEQIYFAGGEPLIMDEHYYILEELEKRKRFDVRLIYNTNFTRLTLRDNDVLEYWKKFNNVHIGASLDAMEERAEYWRSGTQWKTIVKNRSIILKQCQNISFSVDVTVSLVNALHIPDFHKKWVTDGLIDATQFNLNLLYYPEVFSIINAPNIFKDKLITKYNEHLEWLIPLDNIGKSVNGYTSMLNAINNNNVFDKAGFWKKINEVDNIRNESLLDVFPELECLI